MPDGVATWSTTFAVMKLLLDSLQLDIDAIKAEIGLLDIPEDVGPEVGTLKTDVAALQTSVTSLLGRMGGAEGRITNLQGNVANLFQITDALQTNPEPITFVFGGVPAVNSMINVPLTRNLSITSANLSTNSRYYNNINPSSGTTTFQLRRMPANTLIGAFNVTAGTGAITWINTTGSTILAAGDTLRMTATAVGPDVTDVAITIHATRRA